MREGRAPCRHNSTPDLSPCPLLPGRHLCKWRMHQRVLPREDSEINEQDAEAWPGQSLVRDSHIPPLIRQRLGRPCTSSLRSSLIARVTGHQKLIKKYKDVRLQTLEQRPDSHTLKIMLSAAGTWEDVSSHAQPQQVSAGGAAAALLWPPAAGDLAANGPDSAMAMAQAVMMQHQGTSLPPELAAMFGLPGASTVDGWIAQAGAPAGGSASDEAEGDVGAPQPSVADGASASVPSSSHCLSHQEPAAAGAAESADAGPSAAGAPGHDVGPGASAAGVSDSLLQELLQSGAFAFPNAMGLLLSGAGDSSAAPGTTSSAQADAGGTGGPADAGFDAMMSDPAGMDLMALLQHATAGNPMPRA